MELICIIGIFVLIIMVLSCIQLKKNIDQRDEYLNRIEKLKDITKDK